MGESPDRVLRDGERERDGEPERTGATADTADGAEGGSTGRTAAGASALGAGKTPAGATAASPAAASAGTSSETSAETSSDVSAEESAAGSKGGSTVQIRVRDVDSRTTMLRLPVDNKTTALRLPEGLLKAVGEETAELGEEKEESAAPSGAGEGAVERSSGADPRLAMRTGGAVGATGARPSGKGAAEASGKGAAEPSEKAAEKVAEKAEESSEPSSVKDGSATDTPAKGESAAAPAKSRDTTERAEPAEKDDTPDPTKSGEAAESGDADGYDPTKTMLLTKPPVPTAKAGGDAKTAKAGGDAVNAVNAKDGEAGKPAKPEKPEKAEKPAPRSAPAAPAAGTVPEPPAPAPLPDPEPVPQPEPDPRPAPKPVPEPDPRPAPPVPVPPVPAPPVPPLPAPEPLPSPENTAEAMEVLASLNARPVSPLRRALKRITIWTVFLAVVLGAVVVAQLLRPLPDAKVKMSAAGSFSFSGDPLDLAWPAKGQSAAEVVGVGSLGSSGQETPAPIASVTKVMNAYLILQKFPLKKGESGPKITVDKQAAQESGNSDESRVTLTENQVLTEYQALELLMLPSANNVARLLARFHSGSEDAFVKQMNDTAAKFGMTNTVYADPAGFSSDTKSTAKDQLKLAEQVMQDEIFRQIVSTPDTTFNNTKILNTNNLINPKTGVIGVKTGSSTPAGGCLMWAAYKEIGGVRRLILGVTLGQQATSPKDGDGILPTVLKVSAKQIQAAQNGLTGQTLVKKGDVVGSVDDGLGGSVPVVATKDLVVAGFPGVSGTVTLDPAKIGHHEKAGKEVGTLRVGSGADKVEVPVALQSDLDPPSIQSRLLRLL
ncbi:serine hydrolase [Kitasatospora sp. NPDC048194]|uniref:serine hydrolase n=1 Tax=Kitasatospora sp. NPDC048194 TaxID=3364045 RepID=UPI003713B07B